MKEKATIIYDFKNKRVKRAFIMYAVEHGTSVQALIEEALKDKHSKLFKAK